MSSLIISKDGSSTSSGNDLKNGSEEGVSTGSGSGGFYDVAAAIEQANDLVNYKQVQSKIIDDKFPGYNKPKFQNTIQSSGYQSFYAQPAWNEQKWLEFNINPSLNHRYNPSTMRLVIKMQMVSAANENNNLPANTIPVENIMKKLFHRIEIKNLNTGQLINNNIKYNDDILNFLSNWYYDTED